jgi:hypothetical protein
MTEGYVCTFCREGNRNCPADAAAPARDESFSVLKPSCHIHRSHRADSDSASLLKMASAGSGCNVKKTDQALGPQDECEAATAHIRH